MCIVCVLWDKGDITQEEAKRALWELILDEAEDERHLQQIYADVDKGVKKS